jgi:hypothetical protein
MYSNQPGAAPQNSGVNPGSRPTSSSGLSMQPSHQAMEQRNQMIGSSSSNTIPTINSGTTVTKITATQKEKKSGTGASKNSTTSKPAKEKKSRSRLACLACKSTKQKCDGPSRGEWASCVQLPVCSLSRSNGPVCVPSADEAQRGHEWGTTSRLFTVA